MTSAPERIENSIPRIRSLTVKLPSREARTATSRVEPATPFPPTPLPSIAAISPLTKVPWPTRSFTSALRARVSKLRAIRPASSGWLMSTPVSMTEIVRCEPPPAAASASAAWTSS